MHLTQSELNQYLAGRLEESAAEAVARHLETCAQCETLAAELEAPHDDLLSSLPLIACRAASTFGEPESAARQFVLRLERLPVAGARESGELPPALFGEYRLGRLLGRGGMGLVFQAHHRTLDRAVAVKFLPPRPETSTRDRERFLHEARAMAKLRHARLVSALDAGCEGTWTYLVMELLEGIDFAGLARRISPLPCAETCELMRQTAEGLAALHEHGLVHRDLKPSNLMLVAQPAGPPVVKILDLGLSRWLPADGSSPAELDRLTMEGQWLGTLDYVAPGQLRDARQASPAADLYALGATLHAMLTGRPPWPADHDDPLPSRIARRLLAPAEPAWNTRPELPVELVRLTDELLSVDPDRRPNISQTIERLAPWCESADLLRLYHDANSIADCADETVALSRTHATWNNPARDAERPAAGSVSSATQDSSSSSSSSLREATSAAGFRGRVLIGAAMLLAFVGLAVVAFRASRAPADRQAPTATADRRAALMEVLEHGGRIELLGVEGVFAVPAALPEEIPVVRNLTVRGAEWPDLDRDRLLDVLKKIGAVRDGLWLESVDVDTAALERIVRLESVANVGAFVAEHCDLTDPGDLTPLRGLRQIGFPRTKLSAQGVRRLATLTGVKRLDLSETDLTDDGLSALAHLPFRQIILRDNPRLTDRELPRLAANSELESLTLSGTGVTDDGLSKFAEHPRLDGLYLADTAIGDSGLAAVVSIKQLNYLALNDTRVTARGVESLATLPLQDLWLNELRCVDDDVLRRLVAIHTLRNLSLTRTAITDQGVRELRHLPELRLLSLTGLRVTDEALESLAACRELETLFLVDTQVTPAGCARLRAALPKCQVIYP